MSKINVNSITNRGENGPVELVTGASIPSGSVLKILGNASFNGIVTATSFSGDGSDLTGVGGVPSSVSKLYAIRTILDPTPYRS